jgi:carbon storage regulator CsrA
MAPRLLGALRERAGRRPAASFRPEELEMLVLNRKMGEAVVIAGEIRIVVLESGRRGARLGIEAPAETVVVREELRLGASATPAAA